MLTKYRPSGTFTGKIFAGAPLVLLAAAVLGAVYQAVMHWIPIIFLELLAVVFMCVLTGGIVAVLTKSTHCRNRVAGAVVGLMAGLVAVGVSHFVEYRLSRPAILAAVPAADRANADAQLDFPLYCEIRAEQGWTIGKPGQSSASKPTISGVMVYIFWGIEAVVIIGAGALGGFKSASKPYCEPCGVWADHDMLKLEVPEPTAQLVGSVSGAADVAGLFPPASALTPPPPAPIPDDPKEAKKQAKAPKISACMRYSVTSCPKCKMLHTLAVEHEVVTVKGGKSEKKKHSLHESVVLSSEEVGRLAQLKG